MSRTKLSERILPNYTKGEEVFNTVTHIIGGGFGVIALISCVIVAAFKNDVWGIIGSSIYGVSLILLYAVSSVYHGLHQNTGKKVMQIIDHCAIFFLIAGTYTPILLGPIRRYSPVWCWCIFALVWGCAVIGIVFNAIDLKKYAKFSMICYIGMGWCIVLAGKAALASISAFGLLWLLAGGISYTLGAVLYGIGTKKKYMHSIFHIFVVIGSILQFIAILFYIL